MGGIVVYDQFRQNNQKDPDETSNVSVEQLLRQESLAFNQEFFQSQVALAKDKILDTGGVVFIPLLFGMPCPDESTFKGNVLQVPYEIDYLVSYSSNSFTDTEPNRSRQLPLRSRDVADRAQSVREHKILKFPNKPNCFHQMNGITTLTDDDAEVRISLNCPYPLVPSQESGIRHDSGLPVPFNDHITTRIYFAAYLRLMGFDNDFIANALSFQPVPMENTDGDTYSADSQDRMTGILLQIPILADTYRYSSKENEFSGHWVASDGTTINAEKMYRLIIDSAVFQPDGSIKFDIGNLTPK